MLRDSNSYLWHSTRLRPSIVATERHPKYERAGCTGTLNHIAGVCSGNYTLSDGSHVIVNFEVQRDRV